MSNVYVLTVMLGCEATSRSVDGMKQWCLSQANFNKKKKFLCILTFHD